MEDVRSVKDEAGKLDELLDTHADFSEHPGDALLGRLRGIRDKCVPFFG